MHHFASRGGGNIQNLRSESFFVKLDCTFRIADCQMGRDGVISIRNGFYLAVHETSSGERF
jgi:hypothetical protein